MTDEFPEVTYTHCLKCKLHVGQWGDPSCDPMECDHEALTPPMAMGQIRRARTLLVEAFHSGELSDYEEGCIRAAVSSLNGALDEIHPCLGAEKTRSVLGQYFKGLDEYRKQRKG